MLFEDDTLYAQNGISSAYYTNFSSIIELQGTVKGCAIIGDRDYHILNPVEGEVLPLNIETEYTGGDDFIWSCPFVDLMLFNTGNEAYIDVEVDMLGTINESKIKRIHINKGDFKNDYLKVRVSPAINNGQAFRLSLKSNDKVAIQSIAPRIERISEAGFTGLNY